MKKSQTFRADQVGSLYRPQSLIDARRSFANGSLSESKLAEIEDEAIADVVRKQEKIGFPIVTDGEFRRYSFLTNMLRVMGGFSAQKVKMDWHGGSGKPVKEGSSSVVGAPLVHNGRRMNDHETAFLQKHAKQPFKVTVPSASMYAEMAFAPGLTDKFYKSPYDLLPEFVAAVRQEIQALVDENVAYIQIDNSTYPHLMDSTQHSGLRERGLDPERWLDDSIAADNASIAVKRNESSVFGFHICRGNYQGLWRSRGGYDAVAEKLFNELNVDRFLLEYDDDRSGSFEPLRFVPKGKCIVLGLVTTKNRSLETRDELLRRIEIAAQFVSVEYLAISPQCGFSSLAERADVMSDDDQWRKLELVMNVAEEVWGNVN